MTSASQPRNEAPASGPQRRDETPASAREFRNETASPGGRPLERLRGDGPAKRHNARTIAALTGNPGCTRRALLDAAGVDKPRLAQQIGFPAPFGQSRFALARGNAFEAMLKADSGALLLEVLREVLDLDVPEVGYDDLGEDADATLSARHARTRDLLSRPIRPASPSSADPSSAGPSSAGPSSAGPSSAGPSSAGPSSAGRSSASASSASASSAGPSSAGPSSAGASSAEPSFVGSSSAGPGAAGAGNGRGAGAARAALVDHPLLTLEVAGQRVFLEPDLIAFQVEGRLHVVEIKSFAIVDGQADSAKVSAAAVQAAVYVLALRRLLAGLGHDPALVSHDVVLVCPRDFSLSPMAVVIDVRKQLATLQRQLTRLASVTDLAAELPAWISFDVTLPPAELLASLDRVEARYAPECLSACELAVFCRHEAAGSTAALGRPVRDALGGVATVEEALQLAAGTREPTEEQAEAAALLQTAARLRAEILAAPADQT